MNIELGVELWFNSQQLMAPVVSACTKRHYLTHSQVEFFGPIFCDGAQVVDPVGEMCFVAAMEEADSGRTLRTVGGF